MHGDGAILVLPESGAAVGATVDGRGRRERVTPVPILER